VKSWIRICILVKSWIRIRIKESRGSATTLLRRPGVGGPVHGVYLGIQIRIKVKNKIRIRFKVKRWIRIRITVKSWIRIRIEALRGPATTLLSRPGIGGPVHGVYLGEVAAQRPARPHEDAPHLLPGLDKTRVFGVFCFLGGIFGFFWFFLVFFLYICPEERVFRVLSILLGASRL
jgi:hypothetical protein